MRARIFFFRDLPRVWPRKLFGDFFYRVSHPVWVCDNANIDKACLPRLKTLSPNNGEFFEKETVCNYVRVT